MCGVFTPALESERVSLAVPSANQQATENALDDLPLVDDRLRTTQSGQLSALIRSVGMRHITTATLSCRTNEERGGRAECSSGLRCRQRAPSPMEYVRHEGGRAASARSGGDVWSRFRWPHGRGVRV